MKLSQFAGFLNTYEILQLIEKHDTLRVKAAGDVKKIKYNFKIISGDATK